MRSRWLVVALMDAVDVLKNGTGGAAQVREGMGALLVRGEQAHYGWGAAAAMHLCV